MKRDGIAYQTAIMDTRVKIVISLMRQRLADPLSLRILSKAVNLSPSRLRQLFTKELGRSPRQYLRELRFREAEHLLRSTFFSIKEVTFLCGANDVSHFVRDFKKRYGRTPSEFRAWTNVERVGLDKT
jgi:transcriptional regulator GlxA family with amidase domain